MLYVKSYSIDDFLIYIDNLLNYLENTPQALELLTRYPDAALQLQEGRMLLAQARVAYNDMLTHQRSQKVATTDFHEAWSQARERYQLHLQIARRTLGNDAKRLLSPSPAAYSPWLAQASRFYTTILSNPTYQEKLRQRGILAEEFGQALQLVNSMDANKKLQTQTRQNVRLASEHRKLQHAALTSWHKEIKAITRLAFRHHPVLLETMNTFAVRLSIGKRVATKKAVTQPAITNPLPALTVPAPISAKTEQPTQEQPTQVL